MDQVPTCIEANVASKRLTLRVEGLFGITQLRGVEPTLKGCGDTRMVVDSGPLNGTPEFEPVRDLPSHRTACSSASRRTRAITSSASFTD